MSIFDLAQSASELPQFNKDVSKIIYEQHAPRREVSGSSFPDATIRYKWDMTGNKWWIPNRSYIRMRCTISSVLADAGAAGQPGMTNDVAPNYNMMANLFQSMEFRIADRTVSRIDSYISQVSSLQLRMNHSKGWLDGIGKDLELLSPSQEERASAIASDGLKTEPVQTRYHPGNPASTVAILAASGNVAGINTLFNTELRIGDILEVTADLEEGRQYIVDAITDDTNAHVHPRPANNLGANANWVRKRVVGNHPGLQKNQFEVIWKVPLDIFQLDNALPAGSYELLLNPQTTNSYRKRAVESLLKDLRPVQSLQANNLRDDIDFVVDNMYLYVATVDGLIVNDVTYYMNLNNIRCQSQEIDPGANNLQQKSFDIGGSTHSLSIAFQDSNASSDNTLFSASKFKIRAGGTFSDIALSLQRVYVQYALQTKPSPDAAIDFSGTINYLQQRYADTVLYSGQYFNDSGPESFQDYLDRGIYLHWVWAKNPDDKSTRVQVNFQLSENPGNNGRVLLFSHEKRMAIVSVRKGRVVDVITRDS